MGRSSNLEVIARGFEMEGIQVFTATKAKEREGLGERVTEWLREEPPKEILDMQITQSSDDEFHCLTFSIWYRIEDK
jgi:hypothetical protein